MVDEKDEYESEVDVLQKYQPRLIKNGRLTAHQIEGLNWLINLYKCNANGLLADQMGLGKTIQTLAFLAYLREVEGIRRPHLIVSPLIVVHNWKNEINKWFPECNVEIISAVKEDRHRTIRVLEDDNFDILITSYEGLVSNLPYLKEKRFVYFVIDEAHKIKNKATQVSRLSREVPSEYRLLLSGTPLSNNPSELWSLLNFIMPNIFDTEEVFESLFSRKQTAEVQDDELSKEDMIRAIHRIISPFMLRRLKHDTNINLKEKREIHVYCPMSNQQINIYRKLLFGNPTGGKERNAMQNLILQLRKASIHPYMFPEYDTEENELGEHLITNSGKFVVLDKMIAKFALKEKQKILIFSQFTTALDIVEDYLNYKRIEFYRLDGQTPVQHRNTYMTNFNKPENKVMVFILSTRTGGLGVNLTAANIVIILDSDWNPQMDMQAMDRAHRMGQTREVYVYRLITKDSIEEKILERQTVKLKYDFLLLEKARKKEKLKEVGFALNRLDSDEIRDLAYFGVSNILQVGENQNSIENVDLDQLLAEGEAAAEKLKTIFENKVKEFGENALNFEIEHNYSEHLEKMGFEEYKKNLSFEELQNAYRETERRKEERRYRESIIDNIEMFEKLTSHPKPHEFYDNPDRLVQLRAKQDRWEYAIRWGLSKKPDYKLTEDEKKELSALEKTGFGHWTSLEFRQFIYYSGKYGRLEIEKISNHLEAKYPDEIYRYARRFWEMLDTLDDGVEIFNLIERKEHKLIQKRYLSLTVSFKVTIRRCLMIFTDARTS